MGDAGTIEGLCGGEASAEADELVGQGFAIEVAFRTAKVSLEASERIASKAEVVWESATCLA
jgi:hypothetical protein